MRPENLRPRWSLTDHVSEDWMYSYTTWNTWIEWLHSSLLLDGKITNECDVWYIRDLRWPLALQRALCR
jgi:hypothetical protein